MILFVRTEYKHWGRKSGYNRLVEYVGDSFSVMEVIVPMRNQKKSIFSRISEVIFNSFFMNASKAYDANDFFAELKVLLIVLVYRIDVVHFMDGEHGVHLFPALASRIPFVKKSKVIVTYHQPASDLDQFVNDKVLSRVDTVIVLCEEQVGYFSKNQKDVICQKIHHGVDTQYFNIPSHVICAQKSLRCLTVGSWLRDFTVLVNTARELVGNEIEFHVVHGGQLQNPIPENIFLHKNISDEELLNLYQKSDILFMPLIDATANNVVLEGMACGLPVLSNNLSALYEYTGFSNPLLLDGSVKRYVTKLLELRDSPEMLSDLSAISRNNAEKMSWENISREYVYLYHKLLENR